MTHLKLRILLEDDNGNVFNSRKIGGPENRIRILYSALNNVISEAVSGSRSLEQTERDRKPGMGTSR